MKRISLLVIGLLLVAMAAGYLVSQPGENSGDTAQASSQASSRESTREHAEKHLDPTYVCPMHPDVTSDEPGNCPICGMDLVVKRSTATAMEDTDRGEVLYYRHPHNPEITSKTPAKDEMGMDFIPVYANAGGTVTISRGMVQNLGVRTATAERGKLWRKIDTVGYIEYNEALVRHIHPRAAGWVQDLNVRSEGERVEQGDILFRFYSPDIVNAQEEFISALESGNRRLINASRERLKSLDVTERDIESIATTRLVMNPLPYYATRDEVVSGLNVREGMYVSPSMEIMSLADLSSVWLEADVFAAQASWVAEGQPVDATLPYRPGETWEGRVDFVSPVLDPKTRTVKARLRFPNQDESLKPNMFANVSIYGGPKSDIVIIPREALIRTGKEDRVILAEGEGRFSATAVVPGMESGDYVEIIAGIEPGDEVVTSGQFLIDSEASLNASLERLESRDKSGRKEEHVGHDMTTVDEDHSDHEMDGEGMDAMDEGDGS
ncbi:MAG: efflux RND transporter periplasmic adaptor subunit [Gammaproteobacteria bacterium]|nr:efflux RND transporter periplasmic adaptor subunit [Gammaproteobacteria bacterium]